jgi:hypothetical protein
VNRRRPLVLALIAVLALAPMPAVVRSQATGLPDHFGFGIEVGQGDTWMPESGIPWDFRWQYLAGGVNTNQGWETWNPNGTFALNDAKESDQRGYIPMFPYYELFQSRGNCDNCDENEKNIKNLNNPPTMRAYFENFALLMKRLGPGTYAGIKGYGKITLINVEPDCSGAIPSRQSTTVYASDCATTVVTIPPCCAPQSPARASLMWLASQITTPALPRR